MNFLYSIAFRLTGVNQITAAEKAAKGLDSVTESVAASAGKAGRSYQNFGGKATNALKVTRDAQGRLRDEQGRFVAEGIKGYSALGGSIAGLAVQLGLLNFGRKSLNAAADLEGFNNVVQFTSGSMSEAQRNTSFFNSTIAALKLPIQESMKGFETLLGSVKGTNISMETTRKLFAGVGAGARVLNIKADKVGNAFVALGQIASKGVVSSEELRQQLGDALPSAANIAARAMNMPLEQFNKMLASGKVLSEDFLPKFATELEKTFAGGVSNAVNSARANFDQFNNSIYTLSQTVGAELLPAVIPLINDVLVPTVTWVGQNIEVLGLLGTSFLAVRTAAFAYTAAQGIATIAAGGFTGTIWGLNAALLANPMTWVVGGLVAMGAGAVYAWHKFEGFRNFMSGFGLAMWELGNGIYQFVMVRLEGLLNMINGFVNLDFAQFQDGLDGLFNSEGLVSSAMKTGERMGEAYKLGAENGMKGLALKPLAADSKSMNALKMWKDGAGIDAISKQFGLGANDGLKNDDGSGTGKPPSTNGLSSIVGRNQTKNIKIEVQNLGSNLTIHVKNAVEAVDEINEKVQRGLLQALNTANQTQ